MLKLEGENEDTSAAIISIELNENIPDIKAHFPAQMLIPAYMQLSWVENSFSMINIKKYICEFKNVKFKKKIEPWGKIEIRLDLSRSKGAQKFEISRNNEVLTSGVFLANE